MKFKLATAAAAVLMSATASQAADLAKKAPVAVDYVKVCDAYGAGFFYIPGTDTCLKIGGYVRTQVLGGDGDFGDFQDVRGKNSFATLGRVQINVDARSQTEFGVLRAFGAVNASADSLKVNGADKTYDANGFIVQVDKAYIQWAGFTLGYATSMWDFFTGYTMQLKYGAAEHDDSRNLAAYTFGFGNGVSATLSVEDPTYNSRSTLSADTYPETQYGAVKAPEIVAKLNIDQAWGSAQLMGVAHHNYGDGKVGGSNIDEWGYAVGAGVKINLPMLGAGDQLALQAVYADGAATYIGGEIPDFYEDTQFKGWSVEGGFKHVFSPAWTAAIDLAYASYDDFAIDSRFDAGVNLAWTPVTNLTFTGAVEYRSYDYNVGGDTDAWVVGLRAQRNF